MITAPWEEEISLCTAEFRIRDKYYLTAACSFDHKWSPLVRMGAPLTDVATDVARLVTVVSLAPVLSSAEFQKANGVRGGETCRQGW
ncbi:hypothetical protein BaRGS_00004584, partial [Batillaria attramentaria]